MTWEIAFVVSLLGTAGILLFLGDSVGKTEKITLLPNNKKLIIQEHAFLKFFFLIIALAFVMVNMGQQNHILDANNETISQDVMDKIQPVNDRMYITSITILLFTIGYFFVYYIRGRAERMRDITK